MKVHPAIVKVALLAFGSAFFLTRFPFNCTVKCHSVSEIFAAFVQTIAFAGKSAHFQPVDPITVALGVTATPSLIKSLCAVVDVKMLSAAAVVKVK